MKEAAGEANMTVITIVLIAIVLAAGTLIVTNMINGSKGNKQNICAQHGGVWNGKNCFLYVDSDECLKRGGTWLGGGNYTTRCRLDNDRLKD